MPKGLIVYENDQNEYGCPLRHQTGAQGVNDFAALIARLSPEQRAAFESERAQRQDELDGYIARYGYQT